MSERALREIYLKGFQIAIKEGNPMASMTSYNLINGKHTSEKSNLIIDVVRNEWNFNALIMTDWAISGKNEFKNAKYPAPHETIKDGVNLHMIGH